MHVSRLARHVTHAQNNCPKIEERTVSIKYKQSYVITISPEHPKSSLTVCRNKAHNKYAVQEVVNNYIGINTTDKG